MPVNCLGSRISPDIQGPPSFYLILNFIFAQTPILIFLPMKKILLAIAFIFSAFAAWAQEKITDELKALSDNGKYDEIVSRYTSNTSAYPAKALCYIGQAYYMKEDNENCLKYMDMAIAKDSKIAEACAKSLHFAIACCRPQAEQQHGHCAQYHQRHQCKIPPQMPGIRALAQEIRYNGA